MPATLCINIQSTLKIDKEEIKFYEAEEWSVDSEKQFLAKIKDIFAISRGLSKSFQVSITIDTPEVKEVSFLIQRKVNTTIEINNQKLSIREIEVLGLIMQGLTNNEIAEKLSISLSTVKTHLKNSYSKLQVQNKTEAINKHFGHNY